MRRTPCLAAALLFLAACEADPVGPEHVPCDVFLNAYQTVTTDTVTTAQGLQYIDIAVGSGTLAEFGMVIDVNYSLYNLSGQPIESTCATDANVFRFQLGSSNLIPGFNLGIAGMGEGGVRRIIVPTQLGYSEVVVFDIQLVDVL